MLGFGNGRSVQGRMKERDKEGGGVGRVRNLSHRIDATVQVKPRQRPANTANLSSRSTAGWRCGESHSPTKRPSAGRVSLNRFISPNQRHDDQARRRLSAIEVGQLFPRSPPARAMSPLNAPTFIFTSQTFGH